MPSTTQPIPMLDVLTTARTLLDDDLAVKWTDPKLLPKAQQAFRELRAKYLLCGIPVVDEVTAVLNVPANTTDLSTVSGYPTDMIVPIWMKERQVGDDNADFIDMTPRDFIPNADQDIWLFWWAWRNQKIYLLGSLNAEQVQLRYRKDLTLPLKNSDSVLVYYSENFLAHRTAALAAYSVGNKDFADSLQMQAKENLDDIVRLNTKQIQTLPARRRPYHRRYANNTIIRGL